VTFTYWADELTYCREAYNNSGLNERAVEIPIAQALINQQNSDADGLEVGQVLSHYQPTPWTVLDRYEPGANLNIDLFDHHHPADWIVTISTIEHVRWDEPGNHHPDPDGSPHAIKHLHSLLRPDGQMLVTIPMGWHPPFDSLILDGHLPVKPTRQCTMVRVPDTDPVEWTQAHLLTHRRYAASSSWADAVWVAEFTA
jgi:SAM-dependent methyltransferase